MFFPKMHKGEYAGSSKGRAKGLAKEKIAQKGIGKVRPRPLDAPGHQLDIPGHQMTTWGYICTHFT